jgi:hypothetical protein
VVALFITRYEMRPADDCDWTLPTTKNSNAAAQVATPDHDLEMEILDRSGFDGYTWNVEVSPSKKVSALLSGDRNGS